LIEIHGREKKGTVKQKKKKRGKEKWSTSHWRKEKNTRRVQKKRVAKYPHLEVARPRNGGVQKKHPARGRAQKKRGKKSHSV